jgi:hypothetical protein
MRKIFRWMQGGLTQVESAIHTTRQDKASLPDRVRPVSLCFEVSLIHSFSQPEEERR